jgi:hypothetical protein
MKIEVANGEIVDKFTILSIKLEKIRDRSKLENIRNEHKHLMEVLVELDIAEEDPDLMALREINRALWEIEDRIRCKEAKQHFDQEFIDLARSVYVNNDRRAELKRRINIKTHSSFYEEKSYAPYSRNAQELDGHRP